MGLFVTTVAMIFFALGLGLFLYGLAKILAPKLPSELGEGLSPYECGELSEGPQSPNIRLQFFRVALVFLLFEVEGVFLLLLAPLFPQWAERGEGVTFLILFFLFLGLFFEALIYVWKKGDLLWSPS